MKVAYVQLVRYLPFMDVSFPVKPNVKQMEDGRPNEYKRGIPHDVLAVYASIIKPTPEALQDRCEADLRGPAMPEAEFDSRNPTPTRVFINGGLTPEEANTLLDKGVVDAVVFGSPWIGNPDLQKRIEQGVALNRNLDFMTFYGPPEGKDTGVGYTDYPAAT